MKTYRVIDQATGGTLNWVRTVDNERGTESADVINEKRRKHAVHLAQRWLANYDASLSLSVVECDERGKVRLRRKS